MQNNWNYTNNGMKFFDCNSLVQLLKSFRCLIATKKNVIILFYILHLPSLLVIVFREIFWQ